MIQIALNDHVVEYSIHLSNYLFNTDGFHNY